MVTCVAWAAIDGRRAKRLPCSAVTAALLASLGCATDEGGPRLSPVCGNPHESALGGADSGGLDGSAPEPAAPVTFESLLAEMASLAGLAKRPPLPFRTCMVSSYDPASKSPQASSETPTGWYANTDWGNYLRFDRSPAGDTEAVLLETDGPGAVVRIWSATPSGDLRIYLDHDQVPALDAPMATVLAGQWSPLGAPFAGMTANGANLELPLPFRTHVKVAWADPSGGFYQVTYRRYQTEADVASFDPSAFDPAALDRARLQLYGRAPAAIGSSIDHFLLQPSSPALTLVAAPGGEAIETLQMRANPASKAALRTTMLSISFDGEETVRAPLGDFFGAGPGLLLHRTLPLEAAADGSLTSRFVMPFAQTAEVRIDGPALPNVLVTVAHRPAPFGQTSRYFHARWHARGPMPAGPYRDLTLASLEGAGAYVGTHVAVGNGSDEWWGEGDDKVWVDDDRFPSLFGTGTEDYFGQGYCSPSRYSHPFRAQSLAAGGFGQARGLFSLLRTHILDPIEFTHSIDFNLELWHWEQGAQITFDTVSYFYLEPGGIDRMPPASSADFRLSPLDPGRRQ